MRTYKCIVVDDEPMLHHRLKKMFDKWQQGSHPELELTGAGNCAAEGIELALRLQPDIVITDIVMPGMNGIDMIASLKSDLPRTVFIVLSSYPDFEYAQQAISMDVLEYLVKVPLRESNMLEALIRAQKKLEAWERSRQEITKLNQERREHIYRLRKQMMEEICTGSTRPSELLRFSDSLLLDIPLLERSHIVNLAVKMDQSAQFQQDYSLQDQKLLRYGILNIMEEIIVQEAAKGFCCEWGEAQTGATRLAAVIFYKPSPSEHSSNSFITQLGQRMIGNIKNYLTLSISIGISEPYDVLDKLPVAWEEANNRLGYCFYYGGGRLEAANPAALNPRSGASLVERKKDLKTIEDLIRSRNWTGCIQALQAFKRNLLAIKLPPAQVLLLASEFSSDLCSYAASDLPESGLLTKPSYTAEDATLDQVIERLQLLCKAYLDIKEMRPATEREEIRKSKAFIELHLSEGIYLEQVAVHVSMNPSYFSELFKREVKEGLSEYVNRRRIERAIELLKSRSYSNIELAEAVGINNERYFCTLFKKITGTTPQKYRSSSIIG